MAWVDLDNGIPILWGNAHDNANFSTGSGYTTWWRPDASLEKEVSPDEMDFDAEAKKLRRIADYRSAEQERVRADRVRKCVRKPRRRLSNEERRIRARKKWSARYKRIQSNEELRAARNNYAKHYQKRRRDTETPEEREVRLGRYRAWHRKQMRRKKKRLYARGYYHEKIKPNAAKLEARRERNRKHMQAKRRAHGISPRAKRECLEPEKRAPRKAKSGKRKTDAITRERERERLRAYREKVGHSLEYKKQKEREDLDPAVREARLVKRRAWFANRKAAKVAASRETEVRRAA